MKEAKMDGCRWRIRQKIKERAVIFAMLALTCICIGLGYYIIYDHHIGGIFWWLSVSIMSMTAICNIFLVFNLKYSRSGRYIKSQVCSSQPLDELFEEVDADLEQNGDWTTPVVVGQEWIWLSYARTAMRRENLAEYGIYDRIKWGKPSKPGYKLTLKDQKDKRLTASFQGGINGLDEAKAGFLVLQKHFPELPSYTDFLI